MPPLQRPCQPDSGVDRDRTAAAKVATLGVSLLAAVTVDVSCGNNGSGQEQTGRSAQAVGNAPCPACVAGSHNGHNYLFCSGPNTFDDARTKCSATGMDLASIDTSDENDFVRHSVHSNSWIGLNDRQRGGAWKWIADGRLDWCGNNNPQQPPGSYANWGPSEPVNPHCNYFTWNSRAYWFCSDWASWNDAGQA